MRWYVKEFVQSIIVQDFAFAPRHFSIAPLLPCSKTSRSYELKVQGQSCGLSDVSVHLRETFDCFRRSPGRSSRPSDLSVKLPRLAPRSSTVSVKLGSNRTDNRVSPLTFDKKQFVDTGKCSNKVTKRLQRAMYIHLRAGLERFNSYYLLASGYLLTQ